MNKQSSDTIFEKISEWLPLLLIAGGLALEWINFRYSVFIWITGFFLYGTLGLIQSIRKKYFRGFSLRLAKMLTELAIIALALAFLTGTNTFFFLLLLILFDRLILIPRTAPS